MNPQIKAQWLAALRSGEYRQGGGKLRDDFTVGASRFCCLGVLCDLAANAGVGEWDGECLRCADPVNGEPIYAHDLLSPPLMRWAGLNENNPRVSVPSQMALDSGSDDIECIATLNDSKGLTFAQIADCIEVSL